MAQGPLEKTNIKMKTDIILKLSFCFCFPVFSVRFIVGASHGIGMYLETENDFTCAIKDMDFFFGGGREAC